MAGLFCRALVLFAFSRTRHRAGIHGGAMALCESVLVTFECELRDRGTPYTRAKVPIATFEFFKGR